MSVDTSHLIDPFHREVYKALWEEIQSRSEGIVLGKVNNYEDYKEKVGYIKALNDSLERCHEIEIGMYGSKTGGEQ